MNTIPDNCMVKILLRVPLPDRVRTGQVCTRWRWLRSVVTARLNSLTILVGPNAYDLIASSRFNKPNYTCGFILNDDGTQMFKYKQPSKWNMLQLQSVNTKTVLGLAALFPNICKLKIALDEVDCTELLFVDMLFVLNAAKLVTLKMFCRFTERRYIPQYVSTHLFDTINSLSTLKHLTLDFDNRFELNFDNIETTTVDLSVIAQLEQFNFFSTDDDRGDVMFDSFQRYSQRCKGSLQIQYGHSEQYIEISKLSQFGAPFCRRFTRLLSFDSDPVSESDLLTFCTRFTSVTSAWVNVGSITIRDFMKNISKLTNLVHLKLSIWCSFILPDDESNDEIMLQSPSVKALELDFCPSNHDNISQFNIPWTFPNVQAIRLHILDDIKCEICHYDQEAYKVSVNILKPCFEKILSQIQIHLSQCSQLHTITEVIVEPFEVLSTPITKQNLLNKIELTKINK